MLINNNDVHLWIASLIQTDGDLKKAFQVLDEKEQKRALRFYFPLHQTRFIAARSALRYILSQYINTKAADIIFDYTQSGKPYLPSSLSSQSSIQFNLAHSHDMAIYAISPLHQVGVDIEYISIQNCPLEVANRYFSAEEQNKLNQLTALEKINYFYYLWTRKEALVKAIGGGLSIPFNSFSVLINENEMLHLHKESWSIASLSSPQDYSAALAINQPLLKLALVYHHFSLKDFL